MGIGKSRAAARTSEGVRSLVIGATGGIGAALAAELARGGEVVRLGRRGFPAIDLLDEASLEAAAATLRETGPFDRIVVATGALSIEGARPEKRLDDLDPALLARLIAINAIGPALTLKHFVQLLPLRGRCVYSVLSARVGSIGDNRLGGWYGYRASKAALNQFLRTAAVEVARKRQEAVLLALHPGTVRTKLSAPFTAPDQGMTPAEAASRLVRVMDTATESGAFLDYAGEPVSW
jgi:NAD(P)-dependent dehydrogenase (short-subunit alcohol dehydrogenase family)